MIRSIAWLVIPALVIGSIWLPFLRHYYVPDARISSSTIQQARQDPPQATLQKLRGERLLPHGWTTDRQVISAAEDLLRGELRLAGQLGAKFRLPFHSDNLTDPTSSLTRLFAAGLVPADLLLEAYELTGDNRFFSAARASILEFGRYERNAWLPRGFLREEHATANRVYVLSDFWRAYRQRADFDLDTARVVLGLAARSAEFLAAPQHFVFGTNHGIMQNIALLRLRLSFPSLPRADYHSRLAMIRLGEQLPFYVSPEGVILEHSAGYQFFGVDLLKQMFRYVQLLNLHAPEEWKRKFVPAQEFADQLRRPDGTVPLYGDTTWTSRWPAYASGHPTQSIAWYPIAGYAVWWDGLDRWPEPRSLRQTVATFSYFPGHTHKHADDLSVLLWAGGHAWWTNVGYWPYDFKERSYAESWKGSNAPHLSDEPTKSERTPRVLSYGGSTKTIALEAVREGPGEYRVRRQVIHVRPDTWLILDTTHGAPGRTSTIRWSTDYGIILRDGEVEGRYILEARNSPARLFAYFFGSPGMTFRTIPKTLGTFRGRFSAEAAEQTVPAVEVTQRANGSWTAVAWVFDDNGKMALSRDVQPKMVSWQSAERWSALLPGQPTFEVGRYGDRLTIRQEGRLIDRVLLGAVDLASERNEIRRAFQDAGEKYPPFHARIRYRQWSTYGLVAVAGMQEVTLLAFARKNRKVYSRLRLLTLSLWVVGGICLSVLLRA